MTEDWRLNINVERHRCWLITDRIKKRFILKEMSSYINAVRSSNTITFKWWRNVNKWLF